MVIKTHRSNALGVLACPVAGIGNPFFRQWVGAHKLRNAVRTAVARCREHALEHGRRRVGVHAGVVEDTQPHTIRFGLIGPAVTQLLILKCCLGCGHGGQPGVSARGGCQQDACQQAGNIDGRLTLGQFNSPGKMPLAEVSDLMGHDGGKFVLRLGVAEQPRVYTYYSTWHGKGIDGRVINHDEFEPPVLQVAEGDQLEHQGFQIAVDQRIVQGRRLAAKGLEPPLPQVVLVIGRKQAGARLPQIGNLQAIGDRAATARAQRQ